MSSMKFFLTNRHSGAHNGLKENTADRWRQSLYWKAAAHLPIRLVADHYVEMLSGNDNEIGENLMNVRNETQKILHERNEKKSKSNF